MDYKKTLQDAMDILNDAEELNMGNYTEDQIMALNNSFIEVYRLIERALNHEKPF